MVEKRWKRRRTEDDFAAELQSHLEHEADEHIRNGETPGEARARAHREFGNVTRARETFRESRRVAMIFDQLVQDVRAAWRGLARYPVAATVAVLSLAAGIGSTTATMTVRNAVFRNPPPLYRDPGELVRVRLASPIRQRGPVPAALFNQWMQDPTLRSAIAAGGPANARDARVDERLDTLVVRPVTPNLFALLGVEPVLGRAFDATAGAGPTPVVISYQTWTRLFDARSDAVGKTLWLDRAPHVVVGVMPQRFWVVSMNDAAWTPLDWQLAARPVHASSADDVDVIARDRGVAPGRMLDALEGGLASYQASLPAGQRQTRLLTSSIRGTPLGEQIAPYVVWLLGASVLLTLAIACTNVAILVIAQWTAREHEIAIRASLGASRGRVVRTLLMESVLMAALGGGLGICVTLALAGVLARGGGASMFAFAIDPWILSQAIVVTVVAGIFTGLAPALYETRRAQRNPSQLPMSSDRVRQRWRHTLVIFEIAVTIALLVVVTATVSSYRRMMSGEVGYDPHGLVMARAHLRTGISIQQMLDAVRSTPGVAAVAPASAVPPGSRSSVRPVTADTRSAERISSDFSLVGAGYFEVLGVPVLMGRGVTAADVSGSAAVAIVNQELATRLWPRPEERADSIGRLVSIDDTRYQVVGVVPSFKGIALSPHRPAIYVPLRETLDLGEVHFAIRANSNASAIVTPVRRALIDLDGQQRGIAVFTLDEVVAVGSREVLSAVFPMMPLIATALLLVAAGLYGVLTFAITRRSHELAIRLAIGATHRDLLKLVTRQSARLVLSGALLGIGLTFVLTRLVQGRGGIFEAPGVQTFLIPLLVVCAVGIVATLGPFRRAMRVSPVALLRSR